ncbi:MAG: 2-C-methyl-D-erythritol 4-phosphate cytidylyltransferase [Gemmataceae bacterium]|nr:2-C-methyl-D-erythritol 4-phosphate cytidylyltransferase [Gemmataceae bacterium]
MSRFAVILPAAGQSSRFGDKEKKVFANLDGRAVWLRVAELFVNRDDVAQTLLVVSPEDMEMVKAKYGSHLGLYGVEIVPGGKERFDSVANALARIRPGIGFVAIHDAARPCVQTSHIDAVFAAAIKTGAALLAVPVSDTVKRADVSHAVMETVPRKGLWLAQTPQVFRRDLIEGAHARRSTLGADLTDDAQLVEAAGHAVHLIAGSASNLKITTRDDLDLAAAILKSRPAPKTPRAAHPFEDEAKW